jgi:energy-coupling factor transport system ATP-binding protein
VIRCRGLVHEYPGGVRALDGIDLEISEGEQVAIVGRNGSGKSTLVAHWNGLLRPTAGTVEIDGRPAAGRRVAELARVVGIAVQDPGRQLFAGRVRAEVAFGPRNLGLRGRALDSAVEQALAAADLAADADRNPYDLGPGRRRLLAVASVLAMRTPIVVLDEPTLGLGPREAAVVRRILAQLAAEGRTIVTISHDLAFVAETAARIVVMADGRVAADGSPAHVFDGSSPEALERLAGAGLGPPLAAVIGARLGLGSTPTAASLEAALAASA